MDATGLLEACKSNDVDYVLLWSIDRFSRQYNEGMIELLSLELAGVKLIDTIDGEYASDDLGGRIKQVVGLYGAEEYSRKLSKNVKRGHVRMKDGGYLHGIAPLGYKRKKTQGGTVWIPDKKHTKTVVKMFLCYSEGMTFTATANYLNQNGYKPKRANYFGAITIAQILRNPAFGGFQTSKGDDGSMRKARIKTFVDPDLWKSVFDSVEPKGTICKKPRRKHVLTGLVFCGECGDNAHLISASGRRTKYRCRGYRSKVCGCSNSVYLDKLEFFIASEAKRIIQKEGAHELVKRIIEAKYAKDKKMEKSIKPLLEQLTELDGAEEALMNLAVAGGETKLLAKKLSEITKSRVRIEAEIEASGTSVERMPKQEAISQVVDQLVALKTNIRPIIEHIERIDIKGKDQIIVKMFGLTIKRDVSKFEDHELAEFTFVPAKSVGRKRFKEE